MLEKENYSDEMKAKDAIAMAALITSAKEITASMDECSFAGLCEKSDVREESNKSGFPQKRRSLK